MTCEMHRIHCMCRYSRNMIRWDGLYQLSPYHTNDVRYDGWRRAAAARVRYVRRL